MGYGLDGWGSKPSKFKRCLLYSVQTGPPSLLSNGYRGLFLRGYSGKRPKLATHFHLVPRSRMVELYFYSPYVFMA
jgi:hypothetical protein